MEKHHNKQFKLDTVQYYKDHKDLGVRECAENLSIRYCTLTKRLKCFRESGNIPVRSSGNNASDEQKEIAHLKHELRDVLDKQFNPDCPNAIQCSDITYIWTIDGFVYPNFWQVKMGKISYYNLY